jgi:hypothetical protein
MLQNGYIAWEGASLIDGSPIVLILTGFVTPTSNRKTGSSMIQSWILQQDFLPTYAAKQGLDRGVCGDCKLKVSEINSCYVNVYYLNNLYRKFKAGTYKKLGDAEIEVLKRYRYLIRIGSYGDPTAVPLEVWKPIILASGKHTGYSHNYRNCSQEWQQYLMASVHSITEAAVAQSRG